MRRFGNQTIDRQPWFSTLPISGVLAKAEIWTASPALFVATLATKSTTINVTSRGACGPVLIAATITVNGSFVPRPELTISHGGVSITIAADAAVEAFLLDDIPRVSLKWDVLDRAGIWTFTLNNSLTAHVPPEQDFTLDKWTIVFLSGGASTSASGGGSSSTGLRVAVSADGNFFEAYDSSNTLQGTWLRNPP